MIVKVLGKQHMGGTSRRTGKDYDFDVYYVSYLDRYVEGEAVKQLSVDPRVYPFRDVVVGGDYNFSLGFNGSVEQITEI